MPSVSMCLGTRIATRIVCLSQSISQHVTLLVSLRTIVTRARRTRRRRAGTPRARGTRPAAAARARATPGTCGTRRAAPRTPRGRARRRPRPAAREKYDTFTHLMFWTLRPHRDAVLLHACLIKALEEPLRGLLAALGGQGEAVWQRQLSCIDGGSHQHLRTAVMTTVARLAHNHTASSVTQSLSSSAGLLHHLCSEQVCIPSQESS